MKKLLLRTSLALLVIGGACAAYAWWAHSDLVTLNVRNMEVRLVVKKIEHQTRASIMVHSNVQGKVTLNVRRMPLEDVLEIVGEQTFSRWSSLYPLYSNGKSLDRLEMSLRGEMDPAQNGWTNLFSRSFGRDAFRGGPGGPGGFGGGPFGDPAGGSDRGRPEFASRGPGRGERGAEDGERRRSDRESMTSEERDERRKQRDALEEELKQTLPPEEQAKIAEQQQQREQMRQEMSNLTPEQRMERFSQMRGPNGSDGRDQRMNSFIKNSTPEQRVERYRRMEERRQRWQQQGGGQGGGR